MLSRIRILHVSDPHSFTAPSTAARKREAKDLIRAIDGALAYFRHRDHAAVMNLCQVACRYAIETLTGTKSRLSYDEQKAALCDAINIHPFDFLVVSGDLLDAAALRNSGNRPAAHYNTLRSAFKAIDALADRVRAKHVIVTNGNHDRRLLRPGHDGERAADISSFIKASNAFFCKREPTVMPIDPKIRNGAVFREARYEHVRVGFPPLPARLSIAAINTERETERPSKSGRIDTHWFATDVSEDVLGRMQAAWGGRSEGGGLNCDQFRIVVGHSPTVPHSNRNPPYVEHSQFRKALSDCGVRLYLCGHLHNFRRTVLSTTLEELCCGGTAYEGATQRIPNSSFACYELINGFPGNVDLGAQFVFAEEMEQGDGFKKVQLPPDVELPREWSCSARFPAAEEDRRDSFFPTVLQVGDWMNRDVRSYGDLFTLNGRMAQVPYPDVYTRYFPSIFQSAANLGSRAEPIPSDVVYVCHQGPFTQFLQEGLNADYLLHQIHCVIGGKLRIVRLWLGPTPEPKISDARREVPEHIERGLNAVNAGVSKERRIIPHTDYDQLAIGLACAGPHYRQDDTRDWGKANYRCFAISPELARQCGNLDGEWWPDTSKKTPGIGLDASCKPALRDALREHPSVAAEISRVRFEGATRDNSRAFCVRSNQVMLFKFAPIDNGGGDHGDSHLTRAQVVLRREDSVLQAPKDGDEAVESKDWSLFRIIRFLDQHAEERGVEGLLITSDSRLTRWYPEKQA